MSTFFSHVGCSLLLILLLLFLRLVTYADPAIAEAAIEQLNNADLGGRPIHIRLDRKEVEASGGFPGELFFSSRDMPPVPPRVLNMVWEVGGSRRWFCNLPRFVAGFPVVIRAGCDTSGDLNNPTAAPLRVFFVPRLLMRQGATLAVLSPPLRKCRRRRRRRLSCGTLQKIPAVFVGNLPWSTTDEDLQQIFAPYEPYDCHVKTNMAGRSRGFGILR